MYKMTKMDIFGRTVVMMLFDDDMSLPHMSHTYFQVTYSTVQSMINKIIFDHFFIIYF